MTVDFGKTAQDYARHRAGFPQGFFDRLFASGTVKPGDRVLDLGTGTGTIARNLALRGCEVTGLDRSDRLLDEAKIFDRDAGAKARYVVAQAEETGLPAAAFDLATAGQCWHWFERPRAAAEARRVLRPGGRLVIAHFDWLPLPGNAVEMTERLILAYNPQGMPHWTLANGTGVYPQWLTDLAAAGFERIETFSFDVSIPYSHEGWRGRIRASAGVAASLPPDKVTRFDAALAAILRTRFPAEPLLIPHRVWAVTAVAPVP